MSQELCHVTKDSNDTVFTVVKLGPVRDLIARLLLKALGLKNITFISTSSKTPVVSPGKKKKKVNKKAG